MYVCKTMRLCSFLLSKGFNYVRVDTDFNNTKFNVWIFESTPELWVAVTEYSNRPKMYK